jgi:hypothetical protein
MSIHLTLRLKELNFYQYRYNFKLFLFIEKLKILEILKIKLIVVFKIVNINEEGNLN